tara:strand:+ start:300 stop:509 length:210 start_codon:yes stop_codon:yes gene_type:complete
MTATADFGDMEQPTTRSTRLIVKDPRRNTSGLTARDIRIRNVGTGDRASGDTLSNQGVNKILMGLFHTD